MRARAAAAVGAVLAVRAAPVATKSIDLAWMGRQTRPRDLVRDDLAERLGLMPGALDGVDEAAVRTILRRVHPHGVAVRSVR